jgi:hypothetical protein
MDPRLGQSTKLVVNRFQLLFGKRLASQNEATRTKIHENRRGSAGGESIIYILCQRDFSSVKLIYQSRGVKMRVDLNEFERSNPRSCRSGMLHASLWTFD